MATCCSQSDRFMRRFSRTMTGRCRSWTRTQQGENMLILLRTQVDRTDKTPVTARCARIGGLCRFRRPAERVPASSTKTGRCADVRERCGNGKRRRRTPPGGFQQREKPQAAKQPAMDLSRDKNAEKDELVAVGNGRGNAGSRSVSRRIWVRSFYAAVGRTGS